MPPLGKWRLLTKIVMVMKITAILLLTACLQVTANGYSQGKITLSAKNALLKSVLNDIKKQTGYQYFFVDQWEQEAKKVNIEVINASLEDVLELCFKDQPFSYAIVKKTIVIRQKDKIQISNQLPTALIDVRGRVVDENGKPVNGVTVTIKGTKTATSTNENGEFSFKTIDKSATLIFTSVNMEAFEVRVGDRNDMLVNLKTKVSGLDEVQIIAYGTTTQRLSTGSVSSVKAEDIGKQPVSNPLLALEGRVPGLVITQSTGMPGSGVAVQIRGQNSIANGNDPFYVIDGVPYNSQLLPGLGSVLGYSGSIQIANTYGNPLSYLNPSDIENIAVLKDADATAIYGSRAANGAILITTKKGKVGQTKVDINMQNGWGKITRKLGLLNTKEYLEMRHEAIANDGLTTGPTDYDINGTWDTTKYTDWQKELIGRTSQYTNLNGTVSGGNTNTQYLIGAAYHRETTVFPGDFSDQKGSLHFNINNVSSNQKFRVLLSGNYLADNNSLPGVDITPIAIRTAPDAPTLYNKDRTLNWAPSSSGAGSWGSGVGQPLAYLLQKFKNKTSNLVGNSLLTYELFHGLEIKSSFGYTNTQTNELSTIPLVYFDPYFSFLGNRLRSARYAINNIKSWIVEPQISYSKTLNKGKLTVLVGATVEQCNSNGQILNGSGYSSDLVLEDVRSATVVTVQSTTASVYKYNALFGRLNYNFNDKYLLNLTARRDGSSRFGPVSQFHDFGAAGIGWIFSKEKIVQRIFHFLNFGKIRANYGTTGNDQIGDYQYLDIYSSTSVGNPYQGANGLMINNLFNANLQWEETRKLEVGLDLGFLKERILFTGSYYRNRSSNQLVGYPLPSTTGFTTISENLLATVQNTGIELSLNTINIKTNSLQWSSSFNLTIPQNKLISFPSFANNVYYGVGRALNIAQVYHFLSVDTQTGEYQFEDAKGKPTSTPDFSTDANTFINLYPKFYGGLQNSFNYKGIQLDFLFQFVRQIGHNYLFGFRPGFKMFNQPVTVVNRWKAPGDVSEIQRYSANSSIFQEFLNAANTSDRAYSDASFIRLKSISLSWQLPNRLIQKAHFNFFKIYMQGQNLLTFTKYIGLDPETMSFTTLPPLKVLTVGLQLGL